MIKLFLDDLRMPPDDTWTLVRSVQGAKLVMLSYDVEEMSLDHDLGMCPICLPGVQEGGTLIAIVDDINRVCNDKTCECACHQTGYDFVLWMAETGNWPKQKRVLRNIQKWDAKLTEIRNQCTHDDVVRTSHANTGNYDPSVDCYWYEFRCPTCGKFWSERPR